MTKKNIIKEVTIWQDLWSLHDWFILVEPIHHNCVSSDGIDLAQCFIMEDSMSANILLANDLIDDEVKKSIRHEISHIALQGLRSVFEDAVNLLGVEAKQALLSRYHKTEEKMVIKLERIIDSFLLQLDDAAKK